MHVGVDLNRSGRRRRRRRAACCAVAAQRLWGRTPPAPRGCDCYPLLSCSTPRALLARRPSGARIFLRLLAPGGPRGAAPGEFHTRTRLRSFVLASSVPPLPSKKRGGAGKPVCRAPSVEAADSCPLKHVALLRQRRPPSLVLLARRSIFAVAPRRRRGRRRPAKRRRRPAGPRRAVLPAAPTANASSPSGKPYPS